MIKCFLSHSSRDKSSYVRVVAEKIKREAKVFDEETFEEGMVSAEEIAHGLDDSTLFVIFLSVAALESKWVQMELTRAKQLFDLSKLERIYPIIIEPGLSHTDARIPLWMRDSLNIQPIFKPSIAARKINARLTELSWKFHPKLKERREIFVGRNDLVKEIEERLDDFSRQSPAAVIASGLPAIGRKALIQHALRKANLVRDSYEFPVISLSKHDSIEDFILKIWDLGLVSLNNVTQRLRGTLEDKLQLAKEIVQQIAVEGERVIIEDRGALIQYDGELVDWFLEILKISSDHLVFGVASQFRVKPSLNRTLPTVFAVAVKEMEPKERGGLLVRYAKLEEVVFTQDDFSFFSELLTGYPEQVLFAVDLVRDIGIAGAKRQSHVIQQYGSDKAKVVLESFISDEKIIDFIYLLAKFEFISYDVLFDIVDEKEYFPILERLLASSVCERMGTSADYIRVNEVVRDYVSRNRFGIPDCFQEAISTHVKGFLTRYNDDNYDVSDYIFSAQESLLSGGAVPDDVIIPSVFIKTLKKLYDEDRNYDEALALAERVLMREKYLHKNTVEHIWFIKCQCLARLRDNEFFAAVQHVREPDRSFLYGFFYRIAGDFVKAEESLNRVLAKGRRDPRVIGELVMVYMQSEEYALAYDLAKENYRDRPGNPINANNYYACLIMREHNEENRKELQNVIDRLSIDPSDRAQEIVSSAKARLTAYYDNDEYNSMRMVEEAIHKFPGVAYPLLTKADLAAYFRNKVGVKQAVDALGGITGRKAQTFRTFIRYKAIQLAMEKDLHAAKQLINKELRGLSAESLKRLHERLEQLAAD